MVNPEEPHNKPQSLEARIICVMAVAPEVRAYEDQFDLSGPTIEFVVGPDLTPVTFHIHEKLVCASSDFCKCAVNGPWKESKSRSIVLDDVDASIFQIYVSWLYRAQLPVRIDAPGHEGNAEYLALARAYVLGDRLQDVAFCDACIDTMIIKSQTPAADGHSWNPVGPVIACIYENTTTRSKVRMFLVDLYVRNGVGNWLTKWADKDTDLPKDFLFDLAVALLNTRPRPEKQVSQPCEYHEHGKERICYKKLLASSKMPSQDVVNDKGGNGATDTLPN